MQRFFEVCRRRGLKVYACKSKILILNREDGLECKVYVDKTRLEQVSEFKYLGYVLDESGTDVAECSRKVASKRRVAGTIKSLVKAINLQLECARILHETLFVPVLMYGSETMLRKEKERFRIRAVQMDNLRNLLGIRRMNRVPNARIRELCRVTKRVYERIDGVLRWFGHRKRMENDRYAKRVDVGVCW